MIQRPMKIKFNIEAMVRRWWLKQNELPANEAFEKILVIAGIGVETYFYRLGYFPNVRMSLKNSSFMIMIV